MVVPVDSAALHRHSTVSATRQRKPLLGATSNTKTPQFPGFKRIFLPAYLSFSNFTTGLLAPCLFINFFFVGGDAGQSDSALLPPVGSKQNRF